MTRTCEVRSYTRRLPEKKVELAFARTTARLFEEVRTRDLEADLDAALQEAFADQSFATTFGMVE